MVELLVNQEEVDRLFDRWVAILIDDRPPGPHGWVIEGTDVIFGNGRGLPREINDHVMLGVTPPFENNPRTGVVKISRPIVPQLGNGRWTAIGCNQQGHALLLRKGQLQQNPIAPAVTTTDFARFCGLEPVVVTADNRGHWYVVADLSSEEFQIRQMTATFANACATIRSMMAEAPQVA